MDMYDDKLLFPAKLLVDYANHLLEEAGSGVRVTDVRSRGDNYVRFTASGSRGGQMEIVAPMGRPKVGVAFFRSLLKVDPKVSEVSWLFNGQSGRGTREIAFYGENGPWLTTSMDNVRAYYENARQYIREDARESFVEDEMKRVAEAGMVRDQAEVVWYSEEERRVSLEGDAPSPAMR